MLIVPSIMNTGTSHNSMLVWMWAHVCIGAHGGWRLTPGGFFGGSPPYSVRQGLSVAPEFSKKVIVVASSLLGPLCVAFQALGLQVSCHLYGFWGLSSCSSH